MERNRIMLKFKKLLFAIVGAFAVLSTAVAAGEELREAGVVTDFCV